MKKVLDLLIALDGYLSVSDLATIGSRGPLHKSIREEKERLALLVHPALTPEIVLDLAKSPPPSLYLLQEQIGNWRKQTFKGESLAARMDKMGDELSELADDPQDPKEAADLMILLLGHAHEMGYDLLGATKAKFKEIQTYEWEEPDQRGVCRHKKHSAC